MAVKTYLSLFREPNGRSKQYSGEEMKRHQSNWKDWLEKWKQAGRIIHGGGLTLNGKIIYNPGSVEDKIHHNGTEIIGGFLLIKAENLADATAMMKDCPIYEFGGYTEIRELQEQNE